MEGNYSSRVDIYDATANTWSIENLRTGRTYITGAAAGNKVLFAGGVVWIPGIYSRGVDIYDVATNSWSPPDSLVNRPPQEAVGMSATTIGNKIYFAGNASDWWAWDFGNFSSTINIYDASANTWSTSSLSIPRGHLAGIAVGNKNYWAGGVYWQPPGPFTNLVEIRDMNSGISTFDCLFQPNAFFSAVLKDNKIVFFTSDIDTPLYGSDNPVKDKFDIYDIATNTWSIGVLPFHLYGTSIISVNNTIYVAGGFVNGFLSNKVWKLEF